MTVALTLDDLGPQQADTVRRDHYGRYLCLPPDGKKPIGYTRATTVAKALDDMHSLVAWKARTAAKGLTLRPELLKMIAVEEDRKRLDDLVEQAAQAGGATERRDEGTALHRALELHFTGAAVPPMFRGDIDAVLAAMDAHRLTVLSPEHHERICVLDEHQIAGTFDLIVGDGSTLYVADFKTGRSLDYSGLAFATQLAIYAGANALYTQGPAKDGSQDRREPMPAVDRAVALVLHVQPGTGRCDIHEVDIAYGRRALDLAIEVRDARNRGRSLITPRIAVAPTPVVAQPQTRREALVARINVLREINPQVLRWVADNWPDGVPEIKSAKLYTRAQFEAIEAVLEQAERASEAPFPVPPAEDIVAKPPSARFAIPEPVVRPLPPTFDEGGEVDAAKIADVFGRIAQLDEPGKAWAIKTLTEARDALVPVSLRAKPTERQYALTCAIEAWARTADDTTCRAGLAYVLDTCPDGPIGAAIGSLTTGEATGLAITGQLVAAGDLVLRDGELDDAPAPGERTERAS